MSKRFEKGDSVVIINTKHIGYGAIGTVVKYTEDGDIVVVFDKLYSWTHPFHFNISSKQGSYFRESALQLASDPYVEIVAGVNKRYNNNGYTFHWSYLDGYGYTAQKETFYSEIIVKKGGLIILTLLIDKDRLSIDEANAILKPFSAVIVERPRMVKIVADSGQELMISVDKARELGFEVSE